ncbi:uncharacterized protein TM35_000951030 [Trypanosoma theileri]|uniref:Mucin TcMUCII n=1 Tax=Trypanosoma theileri TaxID=67003 RepID=A0A1X0NEF6_9TRYP|nr:uncharacterized protein TM35_000951030 [Trypanosoma theileri]ORC82238.1 hypothetical protein TM35_000951030 [Trypanosoma theileri]
MMMMRYVICILLLALCCTCSIVLATTLQPEGGGPPATEVGDEAHVGGEAGGGRGGKGGSSKGVTPLEQPRGDKSVSEMLPESAEEDLSKKKLLDSQDESELTKDPGPDGPQGPLHSQRPGGNTQSLLQPASPSQPVTGDRNDGALSPSANQNDQTQSVGTAASQENEQVVARTESGNNGGSNSGSEQNTVGSLTAEEPNANSEEQKSENAPPSPNENGTQGSNDAGNSNAVQIRGSTDTESEPENGNTPNTNEESSSTTTTTTTTTLPPELTNNKKGDADSSSSSISSSVWVRVPLLIVVILACILVC